MGIHELARMMQTVGIQCQLQSISVNHALALDGYVLGILRHHQCHTGIVVAGIVATHPHIHKFVVVGIGRA